MKRFWRALPLVAALAVALAATASPAAASPLEPSPAVSSDTRVGCAAPCPAEYYGKGPGSASLVKIDTAGGVLDCRSFCSWTIPDGAVHTLSAVPDRGFVLRRWENCPKPQPNGDCVVENIPFVSPLPLICAYFDVEGSTTPLPPPECPPVTPPGPAPPPPPPPPPPPTGPPPLGSRCTIPGSAGADVMRGTPGSDVICGRGGNDVIYGRGGHDLLVGGNGADRLYGGSGSDRLVGGRGNDSFYTRDGLRDFLSGGPGRDRARRDRGDRASSIERRL